MIEGHGYGDLEIFCFRNSDVVLQTWPLLSQSLQSNGERDRWACSHGEVRGVLGEGGAATGNAGAGKEEAGGRVSPRGGQGRLPEESEAWKVGLWGIWVRC